MLTEAASRVLSGIHRRRSLQFSSTRTTNDGSEIIMKIHEYQAKAILKKYGVAVPRGAMATTVEAAEAAAKELFDAGATGVVVKAQIHAGGRGKGGGVKIAKSLAEARDLAAKILGMNLVTHQTGPEGRIVHRLLIRSEEHTSE